MVLWFVVLFFGFFNYVWLARDYFRAFFYLTEKMYYFYDLKGFSFVRLCLILKSACNNLYNKGMNRARVSGCAYRRQ